MNKLELNTKQLYLGLPNDEGYIAKFIASKVGYTLTNENNNEKGLFVDNEKRTMTFTNDITVSKDVSLRDFLLFLDYFDIKLMCCYKDEFTLYSYYTNHRTYLMLYIGENMDFKIFNRYVDDYTLNNYQFYDFYVNKKNKQYKFVNGYLYDETIRGYLFNTPFAQPVTDEKNEIFFGKYIKFDTNDLKLTKNMFFRKGSAFCQRLYYNVNSKDDMNMLRKINYFKGGNFRYENGFLIHFFPRVYYVSPYNKHLLHDYITTYEDYAMDDWLLNHPNSCVVPHYENYFDIGKIYGKDTNVELYLNTGVYGFFRGVSYARKVELGANYGIVLLHNSLFAKNPKSLEDEGYIETIVFDETVHEINMSKLIYEIIGVRKNRRVKKIILKGVLNYVGRLDNIYYNYVSNPLKGEKKKYPIEFVIENDQSVIQVKNGWLVRKRVIKNEKPQL